jgi:hypothetical protein
MQRRQGIEFSQTPNISTVSRDEITALFDSFIVEAAEVINERNSCQKKEKIESVIQVLVEGLNEVAKSGGVLWDPFHYLRKHEIQFSV